MGAATSGEPTTDVMCECMHVLVALRPTDEAVTFRCPSLVSLTTENRFRMNGLLPRGWAMSEQCMGMLLVCSCLLNACMAVPLRVTMVTLP